jgi:hypothetical protein
MRGAIIITLIIVGGLLVSAPLVVGYLERTNHQANAIRLLERPGATSVNLYREDMPTGPQLGCWVVGAVLAGTGLLLAVRELRPAFGGVAGPAPT